VLPGLGAACSAATEAGAAGVVSRAVTAAAPEAGRPVAGIVAEAAVGAG
jgi:hypothetical protein